MLLLFTACFQINEKEWEEQFSPQVEVEISPNTAIEVGIELRCSANAKNTGDETLAPSLSWQVNGAEVGTEDTYLVQATDIQVGEELFCVATVSDNSGGVISGTDSVILDNSNPEITALAISPSPIYNDSVVECELGAEDPNGDELSAEYSWRSGEEDLGVSESLDLEATGLMPADSLSCTVEVTDDQGGIIQDSVRVNIENRAPVIETITIGWSGSESVPTEGDQLVCEISGAVDPDGQQLSFSYSWRSDSGVEIEGDTVPAGQIVVSEIWSCLATASDGEAFHSAEVMISICSSVTAEGFCLISEELGEGESLDMVLLPDGFGPSERYVLTNEFYVMTTEITQGMFMQVMGYNSIDGYDNFDENGSFGEGANYPAYRLSWDMAADFANHMTQLHNANHGTSLTECYTCSSSGSEDASCSTMGNPYSCDGYRLPTEAEWDYAARSGSEYEIWSPNGGGDLSGSGCTDEVSIVDGSSNSPLLVDYAWYCANNAVNGYPYGSKEVGQLLPNGFGLYDMHGNIGEWTNDWFYSGCAYPISGTNPYCSNAQFALVVRSGDWDSTETMMRLDTGRHFMPAYARGSSAGARLVRMR